MQLMRYLFLLLILLLFISGCGIDNNTSSVLISPSNLSIGPNRTQQFYATAYNSDGSVVSGKTFTWTVSGSIGTIDANGLFYSGSSLGSGTITVSVDGKTATAFVTITDKGIITGKVYNAEGGTVSNIVVFLSETPTLTATTSSNGSFTISGISYGTYEVKTIENATYLSTSKEVFVTTAETSSIRIDLRNRLTIENESTTTNPYMVVTGNVVNHGSTEAVNVTVSYTFFDELGNVIASDSSPAGNILSSGSSAFSIDPYPPLLPTEFYSITRLIGAASFR